MLAKEVELKALMLVKVDDRFWMAFTAPPPSAVTKSPLEEGRHVEMYPLIVMSGIRLPKLAE